MSMRVILLSINSVGSGYFFQGRIRNGFFSRKLYIVFSLRSDEVGKNSVGSATLAYNNAKSGAAAGSATLAYS